MKALVDRLSTALAERYVQYLDTFLVDLQEDPDVVEFRCGFSLLRDHQLRGFSLKLSATAGETDLDQEALIVAIFEEIESRVDEAISEQRVMAN